MDASIRSAPEIEPLGIKVVMGCTALSLDIATRTLITDAGPQPFDELVIATGTEPRRHPAVPGALLLRTVDDALLLRDRLAVSPRTAVIGSGILGSEVASAARKYEADTLLIGRSGTLSVGGVGTLLSDDLARLHIDNGVELALRREVVSAEESSSGGHRLRFDDGTYRDADLVVVMIGGSPRTDWLADSGLDLSDGVVCDSNGIAAPGISAVGDVASWWDGISGVQRRVEHQSNAIEQAIAVGVRLARGATSETPVPLFWSEIHRTRITAYGWFSPDSPLEVLSPENEAGGRVLGSRDAAGALRGVIGWNARPAEFRSARADVVTATPPLLS